MRLLLVEDDRALAAALAQALSRHGFATDHAAQAEDAAAMLAAAHYGAVLLDLGLPDGDGLALLRTWRGKGVAVPVIVVTARGDTRARIAGLDAGADDYLPKPFDMDELVARLRAVTRRKDALAGNEIALGNGRFDTARRELVVADRLVPLSARETELAALLFRRIGRVVAKAAVEDQLFGLMGDGGGANAIEVYVHRLRRKLEAAGAAVRIETIRGIGYLARIA
ncbi:response regulator [Sphingomonas abaci]|uniref:DNA-binding response OmpR family regulator n=1 Tax=Sphingomonas abaci TaxID=237611 RepID=A0A7W7F1G8_9SPHN|nr:DNA-binding response OmpR family regulator [Sphingomonas abaci]